MSRICLVAVFLAACCASALAAEWHVGSGPMNIIGGVSCLDTNTCYVAGSTSHNGTKIYGTLDGGLSWGECPNDGKVLIIFDIAMGSRISGVSSGVSLVNTANQFTVDGQHFEAAVDIDLVTTCQSAEVVSNSASSYGLVGTFGSTNGVAFSNNGGLSYKHYNWGLGFDSRYGSFPSESTWFVAGGDWPNTNNTAFTSEFFSLTEKVHIHKKTKEVKFGLLRDSSAPTNNTYQAGITKTTDGGKTFKVLYNVPGKYYFNQISCADENNCWAVAEGSDNWNGAGIFATNDGGATWTQQHYAEFESLMAIRFLNDKVGFAGGVLTSTFEGRIYKTVDGGKTWDLTKLPGIYVNDFSIVNENDAYATAFTEVSTSVVLHYY